MELPEQFREFDYLIEIIRKLVNPNFLKTKEEGLKFYLWHSVRRIFFALRDASQVEKFLLQKEFNTFDFEGECDGRYNLLDCTGTIGYFYTKNETKKLTEQDIFRLLDYSEPINLRIVLINMINPFNEFNAMLIEKDLGKKIYPLDNNLLFQATPLKFLPDIVKILQDDHFIKYIDNRYITVTGGINDNKIVIPRSLFDIRCHFNDIIKMSGEHIDTITVPFAFHDKAAQYFVSCLTFGRLVLPGEDLEEHDFAEFKNLMLYFQVSY